MSSSLNIDVSIIIPNWNGGEVVADCLESILHNTRGVNFELIIVDNGSTDESPRLIRAIAEKDPQVRVVFNDRNLLFATACNQGYECSRGRYILVANNDILLQNDAITSLVQYAEDHPSVAVVTPQFVDRAGQRQEFVRRLPNAIHVIGHYHPIGRAVDRLLLKRAIQKSYFYRDRGFQTVEEIEQAGASFSLFRREVINRTDGLFDENFPLLFNDVDLYRRINDEGLRSHVVPEIRVVHLEGVSSRKFDAEEYQRLHYQGMFGYFKKHHPLQYRLLVLAWPIRWLDTRRQGDAVATW